jgi:hypothetical protein
MLSPQRYGSWISCRWAKRVRGNDGEGPVDPSQTTRAYIFDTLSDTVRRGRARFAAYGIHRRPQKPEYTAAVHGPRRTHRGRT